MQVAPHYEDVVSEVAAFLEERLRSRSARGSRRSASVSIRVSGSEDARPEPRVAAAPRRSSRSAGRARGLSRKSTLARSRRAADPAAPTPPLSAPRSPPSTAARRSSASTTCAPTSRRSRLAAAVERGSVARDDRAQGIELLGLHGVLEHERREGQRFLVDVELDLADTGRSDRPHRGRCRLPRCRRGRRRRSRTAARSTCSRRLPPRSPTRSSTAFRSRGVAVRVRKPDVVLPRPSSTRRWSSSVRVCGDSCRTRVLSR